MAIGTTDKFSFYIVKKADEPPADSSKFEDFSGYFIKWEVIGNVSELKSFEGIMAGDLDTDYVKEGNYIYVLSGQTLVGKFKIFHAIFKNDYTCEIKGLQSTGTEIENRDLSDEITGKTKFIQETLTNIFTGSNGIFVNSSGNDIISLAGMEGSTDRFNINLDYDNRVAAMNDVCVQSGKEWEITHGANDSTPFSDGDEAGIYNRIGSPSSTYTFYLTGSDMNCSISSGDTDIDSSVNDCIVKGTDQKGAQTEARLYDSTVDVTYTDGAIDGWLYEDVTSAEDVMEVTPTSSFTAGEKITGATSGATAILLTELSTDIWEVYDITGTFSSGEIISGTEGGAGTFDNWYAASSITVDSNALQIKVHKGSGFGNYGSDFMVKIDSELIRVASFATGAGDFDYLYVYSRAAGASDGGRGQTVIYIEGSTIHIYETKPSQHKANTDVVMMGQEQGGSYTYFDIQVEDSSILPSSGTVRIGSEEIDYQSKPDSTSIRTNSASTPGRLFSSSYAHGDGIRVIDAQYTPDNPETDSTIDLKGPISKSLNAGNQSRDSLDRKAQNVIENRSYSDVIQLNVSDYFSVFDTIELGDTVTLSDTGTTNITATDYRIMGFSYSFDYGQIELILFLQNNNVRTWTNQSNSFVKTLDEANQPKQQDPSRTLDGSRFSFTDFTGGNQKEQNLSLPARFKDLIDPEDPQDAVTKRYVDNKLGTGGGNWDQALTGTAIQPTSNRNVIFSKVATPGPTTVTSGLVYFNTTDSTWYGWDGSAWVDLVSGGSAYWQDDGTGDIQPVTSGSFVVPNGSSQLGKSTNEWLQVWADRLTTKSDDTSWETDYNGISIHKVRNIYPGMVTSLEVEGDIYPQNNLTFDMGRSGYYWLNMRSETYIVDDKIQFNATGNPQILGDSTFGVRLYHYGTAIANFRDTNIQMNRNVDIAGSLIVSDDCFFDSDVDLGNASGDIITVDGTMYTYAFIYFQNNAVFNDTAQFNDDVFLGAGAGDIIYVNGDFGTGLYPTSTKTYDLGSSSYRWDDVYCDKLDTDTRLKIPVGTNMYG